MLEVVELIVFVWWFVLNRDLKYKITHLLQLRDCFRRLGAHATMEASVNSDD
jgi:hypothetical protein